MKNLEAEQVVLGSILADNNKLFKSELDSDSFAEPIHKAIFERLSDHYVKGLVANPVTLKDLIQADTDVGAYLVRILQMADVVNFNSYCYTVKELSSKRRFISALERKLEEVRSDPLKNIQEAVEGLERDLIGIQANASEYRITTFGKVLEEIADDVQNYQKAETTSTGFSRLDLAMNGGLERGLTYCVAARPKAGKTMLKGSVANNLRKANIPFLFIAAEMGRKQIAKRMIGADTGIRINEMNKHNLEYVQYLTREMKQSKNMHFVDAPRISLDALRLVVTNAVKTRGIEGFVLDYLQLVTGKDSKTTIAEHQENVAQTIAEICKKENIWCLYSCQINRSGEVRNGDGIMMACDWLYEITPCELLGSEESAMIYLKHLATRNFKATDIGDEENPAFKLINGTHFNQL